MAATMKDFGIDRLPPDERAALADEILASLPPRLTGSQRVEFARRSAELEADPGIALTWADIRAAVEGRR